MRRHVRLVDYPLHDGLGATGWVAVEVAATPAGWKQLPAGTPVWACGDGTAIGFELGAGLAAPDRAPFAVHDLRNRLDAHLWDGDAPDPHAAHRPLPGSCLPIGATSLHVQGHRAALFTPGERVFIVTEPPISERDVPERRVLVTLTAIADEDDPLGVVLGTGADVTRLTWLEPVPFEMNLEWTHVLGNAIPVTAGITRRDRI